MTDTDQTFYKILNIINDMVDAKEISDTDLLTIFKYGRQNKNPNDVDDATAAEKDSWNRAMFALERHCKEQNLIKLPDNERQPCEVWTRVMGYFRPTSEFNQGKRAEFYERKCFSEEKAIKQDSEFK